MDSIWIYGAIVILLTLWTFFRGYFPGLRNRKLPPGMFILRREYDIDLSVLIIGFRQVLHVSQ